MQKTGNAHTTAGTEVEAEKPPPISIGIPIILLLLLLAGLTGGLLVFAVQGQDRVAREASETIAEAAFNSESESLEQLVRDYSWWNASVENLIFELNHDWIPENLDWMVDNFGVARIFVFGPGRVPVYGSLDAEPIETGDASWRDPRFGELIARAESLPEESGASLSAYVEFQDGLHMVAASKLLQEADTSGHPPYPDKGILVVTKRMDEEFLNTIQANFQLPNLRLQTTVEADTENATMALPGATGETTALVSWNPPQPGTRLLEWLILPLVLAFTLVGGLMAVIIVRARYAGRALQQAFEARVAVQKQLEYSARHDSLTGLPNRALFLEHLASAMAHAERYGSSFTLHYLDLDGFKEVNDTLGHQAGDDLLRELAVRLTGTVRAADTAARFGGDEFAVLQRGTSDRHAAGLLAERLIHATARPFEIDGHSAHVTLSVGIAFETAGDDPEDIIRQADRALYRAKHSGGNRFEIHDTTLDSGGIRRTSHTSRRPGGVTLNE